MARITSEMYSPEYGKVQAVKELTERFNRGDLDYLPTREKEKIAMLAMQYGTDFKPESKPVKKALFDFFDMALFGLVPNKWRPQSVGEEYFGESGADKFAGGVGSVAGLATGVGAVYKGAQGLRNLWNMRKITQGNKMLQLNRGRDIPLQLPSRNIGSSPNLMQMSRNQQLGNRF